MYYVYHIFDGKVGLTKNPEQRVEKEQGCKPNEYEILGTFDRLKPALKAEQDHNERLGYKKTPEWHPDLNKMKTHYEYHSGTTVTLEKDYIDQKQLTFKDKDGSIYTFNDPSIIPTVPGRFPEGDPKPYAVWKVLRNTFEQQEKLVERQFNECADLEVETTNATLDDVFELQKSLQKKFPETSNIGNETIAETATMAQRNLHAFMDEVMEFMDAMGGMHDGFKNGAWKYWKKDYQKAKGMKVSDLSPRDLKELKMEYTDMFHFFVNWGIMIGMTGTELIDYYVAKNKENFERQKRGY